MKKKRLDQTNLELVIHPTDFFKEKVSEAIRRQNLKVGSNTEIYIVDLLNRFIVSENLFATSEGGAKQQEVLALLLAEAMSAADQKTRFNGLRRLGDISLYTAGYFTDSLTRKVVDVDYYIGMGRTAYENLSSFGVMNEVYNELAQLFHKFVDVLAEVSDSGGSKDPKSILRMYEIWLKTKSERAEKNLKKAGIIPNSLIKPDWN